MVTLKLRILYKHKNKKKKGADVLRNTEDLLSKC